MYYVIYVIIVLYSYNYGTFHKKLNDVGRLSGGHYPTVRGRSAVSQRSINGQSSTASRSSEF